MFIRTRDFNLILERISQVESAFLKLEEQCGPSAKLRSKIEDLELWQGKVHSLLIEKDKRGNDKLTRLGRYVAGQSINIPPGP